MLKYFAVENFRSIKEENIVEFDAGLPKDSPFIANPTIGVAGANASGKSSLLQALTFTLWFMQDSFLSLDEDKDIPIEPFITCKDKPTKLHLIFSQKVEVDETYKDVDFEYRVCLTQKEVIEEVLLSYPYRRKRLIYQRNKNKIQQGGKVANLESDVWINLRKNCSIVSFAAQFGSQYIAIICKRYKYYSNLEINTFLGVNNIGNAELIKLPEKIISFYQAENKNQYKLLSLVNIADLGIKDARVINMYQLNSSAVETAIKAIIGKDKISDLSREKLKKIDELEKLKDQIVQRKDETDIDAIYFEHLIEEQKINFLFYYESSGTLQFINTMIDVLTAINYGQTVIIDEIEIKLHQNLVAYIIGLFQNKYENPHGAQLIFSFHNTYFMDILEPSQLWFTEKNDRGHTEIFSAADFKDVKKLQQRSLEELYRMGRFGAKPRGI